LRTATDAAGPSTTAWRHAEIIAAFIISVPTIPSSSSDKLTASVISALEVLLPSAIVPIASESLDVDSSPRFRF
jgi:hypothetical protein